MIELMINNLRVKAEPGVSILNAASGAGIKIPTLCFMKGLSSTGACRICVVEVKGSRNLVPACAFPVSEGMEVQTNSPRVTSARKTIVELLIENHPPDCLICVRNGHCQLQNLAETYGSREHKFRGRAKEHSIDISSPALERDPAKCILCGRCVRICNEIQKIGAIDFTMRGFQSLVSTPWDKGLNTSDCILCGQCILQCPTAALREKSSLKEVYQALNEPMKFPLVQVAPAVRVALGEEFGVPPGADVTGRIVSALRMLGFKSVFDTNFAADLTVMEEATEFIQRVINKGTLPLFTSCCPGWVKFIEQNYPDLLEHLSSCKSPHEMEGGLLKTYYAKKMNLDPKDIFVLSVMPCTVKKFERQRSELSEGRLPDVDAVLTTRELARMIKMAGIDFLNINPGNFDDPLGESSGAAAIFGASGGVMEAALRTAYHMLTGKNLKDLEFNELRGNGMVKESSLKIAGTDLKVAVVNGVGNSRPILEEIRCGKSEYHFVEVMACPMGCINGGGQPLSMNEDRVQLRLKSIYGIDRKSDIRLSHQNCSVSRLYEEFFGSPGSAKAHEILHTNYRDRKSMLRGNDGK